MNYKSLVDPQRVIQVLKDLVSIPSVNPGFLGGQGESNVTAYVKQFFQQLELPWMEQEVEVNRQNVIGILRGTTSGRALLLEAHMDTVQVQGMTVDPFGAAMIDGKIYGRGACDTKASLAAMMICLEVLKKEGLIPPIDIHLAAVVDEEVNFKGVSALADEIFKGKLIYTAAIVGEPTGLDLIIAHKGSVRFYVDVHGVASHSSNPQLGVNAIEQMMEVMGFLKKENERYTCLSNSLVGPPTQCISMIQGGVAPNTVPDNCRITIDRRTIPGEESKEVWLGMKQSLEAFQEQIPGLKLTVSEPFIMDYSMEVSAEEPVVRILQKAAARYKIDAALIGAPYGSDASKLTRVGVPTVVFGPGSITQAHTKDEWIEFDQVVDATAILLETIMNFE